MEVEMKHYFNVFTVFAIIIIVSIIFGAAQPVFATDPGWTPISGAYTMEAYGTVYVDGVKIENPGYVVAAFGPGGDADCRARANIKNIFGEWGYSFPIVSNTNGEMISFKVWDGNTDQIFIIEDAFAFADGAYVNKNLDVNLAIEQVYPTQGEIGYDLHAVVKGTGFTPETEISMFLDSGNQKSIVASLDLPGNVNRIHVDGDYAYLTNETELFIVLIQNPLAPQLAGSIDTTDSINDIVYAGTKVFVANGESGLKIIDIADRYAPAVIGSLDTAGNAINIDLESNRVFIADGENGLLVIDVADPYNPQEIGALGVDYIDTIAGEPSYPPCYFSGYYGTTPQMTSVLIINDKAYIGYSKSYYSYDFHYPCETVNGTIVIETNSVQNIVPIGYSNEFNMKHIITSLENNNMIVHGSHISVIKINEPASPELISRSSSAQDAIYQDNVVYLADPNAGFKTIDFSDIYNPVTIGTMNTPGKPVKVKIQDGVAFVADSEGGLQLIDVKNPALPELIGTVYTPGSVLDLALIGNYAALADGSGGLQIVDISNMGGFQNMLSVYPGELSSYFIENDLLYVSHDPDQENKLHLIDIAKPYEGNQLVSIDLSGYACDIVKTGNTLFVCDTGFGLRIYDYTDPANPQFIGGAETPYGAKNMKISGNIAAVSNSSGINIIDISDLFAPQITDFIELPGDAPPPGFDSVPFGIHYRMSSFQVAFVEGRMIVCYHHSYDCSQSRICENTQVFGIQEYNINNPAQPEMTSQIDLSGRVNDIQKIDSTTFIILMYNTMNIIDFSTPSNPATLSSTPTASGASKLFIDGQKAYVFVQYHGLDIFDISNLANPVLLNTVEIPGNVRDAVFESGMVYFAEYDSGITAADISDPLNPQIFEPIETPGKIDQIKMNDGVLYVKDSFAGLLAAPAPVKISPVTYHDENSVSFTIPDPQIPGHYNLKAANDDESFIYKGAVTFLEVMNNNKAIIVAGGGPFHGNFIWNETRMCANYAYNALLYQGYTRENILYLSSEDQIDEDIDGDGHANDVDLEATLRNLQDAITVWAKNPQADELLIYMADHGGIGKFRLNETEHVNAADLDVWMDELQATMNGRLIFVYDACQSGTFLSQLSPPPGKDRILVTSASDENAYFLNQGGLSFSFQFWASIYKGAELDDAFHFSKDMMARYQTANLEANGNGVPNEKEDKILSNRIKIGRGYMPASDIPSISSVYAEPETLNGQTTASIFAESVTDADGVRRVWAMITPPGYSPESPDTPVTDELPSIELTDENNDGRYEGIYDQFNKQGVYQISVYAEDKLKNYSLPANTSITQTIGEVTVNFTADITTGPAGLTVTFTGVSDSQITSWAWNFGDGHTASVQNPTNVYARPGTYTVQLTATGSGGSGSKIRNGYITVTKRAITGHVKTSFSGYENLNVPYAHVSLEGYDVYTMSDGNGDFILELPDNMGDGLYNLTISSMDLETTTTSVQLANGMSFQFTEDISMTPAASGGCSQSELDQAALTERQRWDANMDNRKGIEEAIDALQVVSGVK